MTSADSVGVVGEDAAPALEVRARQVHLDRDHLGGRGGELLGGPRGSRRRCGPRCWRRPVAPVRDERGQLVDEPALDARAPAARRR